ncbi:hypothetical protein GTA08_BOTSDO10311 [Neofusicoccum parvum]|nr:hypothetical protein GTA08_BOTSDO10311 [Neofusicoccum parvum]
MASTNTSDLPEKPDSAGSASTQTQPPQHIAVQEPTFPVSERAKEERGGWKGLGRFWERRREDGSKNDWWFASTAIPLLAATLGPLANVLSIAALVTYWRMDLVVDGHAVPELEGVPFKDPRWCAYHQDHESGFTELPRSMF